MNNLKLNSTLGIKRGITSIIGSGGKTTLMTALSKEAAQNARVIMTTTTHILPPTDIKTLINPSLDDIKKAFERKNLICIGSKDGEKLCSCEINFKLLTAVCDYIFIEADGSRQLPLKAHLDFEPVIPKESNLTILVVGAFGINKPIINTAHRPEKFAALCNAQTGDIATEKMTAQVINREKLCDKVVITQTDDTQEQTVKKLYKALNFPTFIYKDGKINAYSD